MGASGWISESTEVSGKTHIVFVMAAIPSPVPGTVPIDISGSFMQPFPAVYKITRIYTLNFTVVVYYVMKSNWGKYGNMWQKQNLAKSTLFRHILILKQVRKSSTKKPDKIFSSMFFFRDYRFVTKILGGTVANPGTYSVIYTFHFGLIIFLEKLMMLKYWPILIWHLIPWRLWLLVALGHYPKEMQVYHCGLALFFHKLLMKTVACIS